MDIYHGTDGQDGAPGGPGTGGAPGYNAPQYILNLVQSDFTGPNLQVQVFGGKGGNGGAGGTVLNPGDPTPSAGPGGIGGNAIVAINAVSAASVALQVYGGTGGNGSVSGIGGAAAIQFTGNTLTDSGPGSTWSSQSFYAESGRTGNGGDLNTGASMFIANNSFVGNATSENLTLSLGVKGAFAGIALANNLFDGGDGVDTLTLALSRFTLFPGDPGFGAVVIDLAAGVLVMSGNVNTIYHFENVTIAAPVLSGGPMFQTLLRGNGGNNVLTGNPIGPNTLTGGGGDDTLTGGSGDDSYYADQSDTIVEAAGGGTDTIYAIGNYILPDNVENLVMGLFSYSAYGNTLNNFIHSDGISGRGQYIDGGAGADTIEVYGTSDTYIVDNAGDVIIAHGILGTVRTSVSYTLSDNISDTQSLVAGDIDLTGNGLANHLDGSAGKNRLDGGLGADTMAGYGGNDTYVVDDAGDVVVEAAGGGTDTIVAGFSYGLVANVETLILSGSDNLGGTGNASNNTITGNSGDNALDGGAGADTLAGGAGDDVYTVDNSGDVVREIAGEGTDSVLAAVTYTLSANVENLTLTGSGAINGSGNDSANSLNGNAAVNSLFGNGGNDLLDGGAGADKMYGGAGDDTYYADNTGDRAYEYVTAGVDMGGNDLVYASVSYTLLPFIENLTLTGTDAINGAGNDSNNVVHGNDGANKLYGYGGNDVLDGGPGNDSLYGGTGNDTYFVDTLSDHVYENDGEGYDVINAASSFYMPDFVEDLNLIGAAIKGVGNGLANHITGNSGNNLLDGGLGADSLAGGAGNDSYAVDSAGDVVTENVGEGSDAVLAAITWTLSANFENLTLTGSGAINGTGTDQANILTGNAGANSLFGNGGGDVLDGGLGADKMYGGTGDDTYYVDNAGDRAYEYLKPGVDTGGHDLVNSAITVTLFPFIEDLALIGTAAVNGTGNELDNVMTGNSAANTLSGLASDDRLDGGGGADKLYGGTGNDSYYVDDANDRIYENAGEGTDVAYASASFTLGDNVETLVLTGSGAINGGGSAQDNTLVGNSGTNKLYGFGGNDLLDGGAGADRMYGGTGDDTFTIDNSGDHIYENDAEGHDVARAGISYTLEAFVEDLLLTGSAAINGAGNDLDNRLTGNGAVNKLYGYGGNDLLDGGIGGDSLYGGLGNDTYVVDSLSDHIYENSGEGIDQVYAGVSQTLASNVENLLLTGAANLIGKGNTLDNVLNGNGGGNSLYGYGGNDLLDGGTGVDTIYGGTGDDTYMVDNIGDQTIELFGEGYDLIRSAMDWTLADSVEDLQLTGNGDVDGTGNGFDNALTGNAGANTLYGLDGNDMLDGGGGVDTFYGGSGDDTYVVDSYDDTIIETATYINVGHDLVLSSQTYKLSDYIEDLTLTGNSAIDGLGNAENNNLTGNGAANVLLGDAGDDTIIGGGGNDQLSGGQGQDTFIFQVAQVNGVDSIYDFAPGQDRLSFDAADGYPFGPGHLLTDDEYSTTGTPNSPAPQFVYDPVSHALYWSVGSSMVEIAVFMNMAQPAAEDFLFT